MIIQIYVEKNNAIRARMILSHFSNITDETTTVEYMIDELSYNPDTSDIGGKRLAIKSFTVKNFLHHFHLIRSYSKTLSTTPKSTLHRAVYLNSLRQLAQLHPTRCQMRSFQYQTLPLPRHQTP